MWVDAQQMENCRQNVFRRYRSIGYVAAQLVAAPDDLTLFTLSQGALEWTDEDE